MTSDEQSSRREGQPRRDGYGRRSGGRSDDRRGNRPRYDRGYRDERRRSDDRREGGDRPRREFRSDGAGKRSEDRSEGGREYRPRSREGSHDDRRRSDDRREGGDRPRRESHGGRSGGSYGRRSGDGRGFRSHDDRGSRDNRRRSDDRRDGRGYSDRRPRDAEPRERPKVSVPEDPVMIMRKAYDCEINGRNDLAQILYLHGASKLSGACEKALLDMLEAAGKDQFPTIRGRMRKDCPEDIMPVFDYLCSTLDPEYDVSGIRTAAEEGNPYAIHCLIRMDDIGGEDDLIDLYARSFEKHVRMVSADLELLSKKYVSSKARKYLDERAARVREWETIRTYLKRAVKGDDSAIAELERLSKSFPEAGFLHDYMLAYREGNGEEYIRNGLDDNTAIVLSYLQEINLAPSPFTKYLAALKLKAKGGQWVPAMIEAVKAGSDEALDAIADIEDQRSVRGPLQAYYFAKGDIESLVNAYDGKDSKLLDRYCNGEAAKILEVGRMLGGTKEIHWLSKGCREGCSECREALVAMVSDEYRYGKPLIYALHDAGADVEAAKVYFEMLGDPSLPSVKWLAKVCRNEEAKEFVRSRFEEMNDLETFEDIFVDDGYVPKYKMKGGRSGDRRRY